MHTRFPKSQELTFRDRPPVWAVEIIRLLHVLINRQGFEMAVLDDLEAKVDAVTTVEQSAIVLLQELSDALKAAGTDPVRLQAIVDKLDADQTALAAAVASNTPAAP